MESERLNKENNAEAQLILYNFNKRINRELKEGKVTDVHMIVQSYVMYMSMQAQLEKIFGK